MKGLHEIWNKDIPAKQKTLIYQEILNERHRQDAKFGVQDHPLWKVRFMDKMNAEQAKQVCAKAAADGTITWKNILLEEVLEAFAENDPTKVKEELIQVAAVCVSIVECMKRKGLVS